IELIVGAFTLSSAGAPSVVSPNPSLLALAFPAFTAHGVGQPTEVAIPSSTPPFSALLPHHLAQSSTTFEVRLLCTVNAHFDCAVAATRRALNRNKGNDWPSASGAHRARYLHAIAAKVIERKDHLAKLESLDCGKPLDEAAWDMDDVAGCFEFYADLAEKLDGKQKAPVSLPMETFKSYVLKETIDVVGLITPWNYPLLMAAWKVAPALAAGCATILKPFELASVTCLELADICKEVGLPPGVLNILFMYNRLEINLVTEEQ
ncbi:hypothetical protein S83_019536, partial [Arachis hypogaea]